MFNKAFNQRMMIKEQEQYKEKTKANGLSSPTEGFGMGGAAASKKLPSME